MGYKKIIIKNGLVFNGENFIRKDIYIADGKISKIENKINLKAHVVYNAKGLIVAPGLIDIHTHIYGISDDCFGTPAPSSFFPFGVTTAVDDGSVKGNKFLLENMKLGAYTFPSVQIKNDCVEFYKIEKLLHTFGDRVVGIKTYIDSSNGDVLSSQPLKKVIAFAGGKGLKVMVHCSNSPIKMEEIIDLLRPGDILTHPYHGGDNNALLNDFSALKKAKEKGVIIDTGMAGHIHTNFEIMKKCISAGLYPNTISSDLTNLSVFQRGGNYGLTLCMGVMRAMGMPETEIFKAVTTNAAAAIGKESNLGYIKIGSRADLAVLDYGFHPFNFNIDPVNKIKGNYSYNCKLTLCDGQIVYKEKNLDHRIKILI